MQPNAVKAQVTEVIQGISVAIRNRESPCDLSLLGLKTYSPANSTAYSIAHTSTPSLVQSAILSLLRLKRFTPA